MVQLHLCRSVSILTLCMASAAVAGPDWEEMGDAGSFPTGQNGAQVPVGEGQLQLITGQLGAEGGPTDFEDMYLIFISDPSTFFIQTDLGPGSAFDTQLFLFEYDERGLLANDDISAMNDRSRLTQFSNDGSEAGVYEPGLYYLAITGFNNDPFSIQGPIFDQASRSEISGPDGNGGFGYGFILGWSGGGAVGPYTLTLGGVRYVPEPGTLGLLALAVLAKRATRRILQ